MHLCRAVLFAAITVTTSAQILPKPVNDPVRLIPSLDKAVMDPKADPCEDFYQFACGNWAKQHPIPRDAPYSGQFYNLQEFNQQVLHGILEEVATVQNKPGTDAQKIGDYYTTCMASPATMKSQLEPLLQAELHRIAQLETRPQLSAYVAHAQLIGSNAFFNLGRMQDYQDATHYIAAIQQGGLGLPERDYYLRTGEKDQQIRDEYVAHIARMLHIAGEPNDESLADANQILQLETALARVSLSATELRDPKKNYNYMPRGDLAKLVPTLDWDAFFTAMGTPAFRYLNIAQPDFFLGVNTVLNHETMPQIRAYLRWQLLNAVAGTQSTAALDNENFDFYGQTLAGIPQQEPRWKRCTAAVDAHLGEALGRLYVTQQFPAARKLQAQQMIANVEAAMLQDLSTLDWMGPQTRQAALDKLNLIANNIGYPGHWRDYSRLTILRGDAMGNFLRAVEFENRRQLATIGQPVDRDEWAMTPPTVNAYYDPGMNDMNFPAGVLQLAFFSADAGDRDADQDALNYGHIGLFMGHEITHGFDDQGRQFDGHGNLRDWWTKDDADKFNAKADCFVDEYSKFQATPDTHLNGKLTLGENTADNGGLRLAYLAYVAKAMHDQVDLHKITASGYTPEQEFYLGFAQDWCAAWRPELERLIATTDPHSPDRFRTNGVLVNFPEFAQAFHCKAGAKMVAARQCRVW